MHLDAGRELRPRLRAHRIGLSRAAVIPRAAGAGDRPMHDVGDIGDGQQRDLRAIEGTAAGRGARLGLVQPDFSLLLWAQAGSFSNSATSAIFIEAAPGLVPAGESGDLAAAAIASAAA
ncbi:MAG: hypothetical protein WAO76_02525 [Georgfuchsia sp.]